MVVPQQEVPGPVLDEVAGALLFNVRSFRCPDIGPPSERFEPPPKLQDDLGGRAVVALEAIGSDIMRAALDRSATDPASGPPDQPRTDVRRRGGAGRSRWRAGARPGGVW